MNKNKILDKRRERRRHHNRKRLRGSADHPRLSVSRSLKHFSCQIIDDLAGQTLVSASSKDADLRGDISAGGNCDAAALVGKAIAEKAVAAGVTAVKMDRGSNKYHGRVKAFAEAAREGGLQF